MIDLGITLGEPSPPAGGDSRRMCDWCRLRQLPETVRQDARFCSRLCRQAAYRARRTDALQIRQARPLRIAYADPPYPGNAKRRYGKQPDYAGEVDHARLIASLAQYDGWALSTSAKALPMVLPLCPDGARVCAWVKHVAPSGRTYGLHNLWEPVIVMPGRRLRPGVRDWIRAQPARGGGDLPGRKPIKFVRWLFRVLGALPCDELDDLFPGTGIVGNAWREKCRAALEGED